MMDDRFPIPPRPIPAMGDDVLIHFGEARTGKIVARGFLKESDATGFQINLHNDGLVSVAFCSRRWPDVVSAARIFGKVGQPLVGLALANAKHGGVSDRAFGGAFDMAQLRQDLMAVWAMFEAEREVEAGQL
ncbi:MAG: hypothetical protein RLZZ157_81 [Pseudomonadota bacterium]|jgi:hypothetical protein